MDDVLITGIKAAAAVIAAATAAWIVVAVGTYLAVAAWRQVRDEQREHRRDVTSALHGRVGGCQMR